MEQQNNDLTEKLVEQISDINSAILKEEDPTDISIRLNNFVKYYVQIVKHIKQIQLQLNSSVINDFLNSSLKSKVSDSGASIEDIDNQLFKLKKDLQDKQLAMELIKRDFDEYKSLVNEKDRIERELREFEEIKDKVESSGISAKNEELVKLKALYSNKKNELEQLEQQIILQNQSIKSIEDDIHQKIKQKNYNDNLLQLENDINQVVKDFEANYLSKQKQSVDVIRYRIGFIERVSGHLLPTYQYDKLDDMIKALDEMDSDIQKKLIEQKNATSTESRNI